MPRLQSSHETYRIARRALRPRDRHRARGGRALLGVRRAHGGRRARGPGARLRAPRRHGGKASRDARAPHARHRASRHRFRALQVARCRRPRNRGARTSVSADDAAPGARHRAACRAARAGVLRARVLDDDGSRAARAGEGNGAGRTRARERGRHHPERHAGRLARVRSHLREVAMYKHILIPTDGSPTAEKAIDAGTNYARESGAKVLIFTAVPEYEPPSEAELMARHQVKSIFEYESEAADKAHAILDKAAQVAKGANIDFDTDYALSNRPYQAIIDAAKKHGCD